MISSLKIPINFHEYFNFFNHFILQAQAIFTLAWFHAIVQERRVFIPQGWAKFYEFSDGDLRAGLEVLDQLSKRSRSCSNLGL